ncbi:MAG: DUF3343 domain-containing protein [Spirochaetales bacterium]|nr:DUF3343 domain-containing protein [Spirochaetales bacterium]
MNSFVLTFKNTHDAMEEEERLDEGGYNMKLIPTPREISSECGFSIRVKSENPAVTEELTGGPNTIERIYLQYNSGGSRKYEEIYKRDGSGLSSAGH